MKKREIKKELVSIEKLLRSKFDFTSLTVYRFEEKNSEINFELLIGERIKSYELERYLSFSSAATVLNSDVGLAESPKYKSRTISVLKNLMFVISSMQTSEMFSVAEAEKIQQILSRLIQQ